MYSNRIITAEHAYEFLSNRFSTDVEEFWALALGPSKLLLQSRMIFRGSVDVCLVHPRDVFRFACLQNASSLIVAHNHPSGDPTPSPQDISLTRTLIRSARLLQIPLNDHLIMTQDGFVSLAREGLCRFD